VPPSARARRQLGAGGRSRRNDRSTGRTAGRMKIRPDHTTASREDSPDQQRTGTVSADTPGTDPGERRERQAGGSCQRWLRCLDGRPSLAARFRRCRPACSSPYRLVQDQARRPHSRPPTAAVHGPARFRAPATGSAGWPMSHAARGGTISTIRRCRRGTATVAAVGAG
jgi:hypothetical protein